MKVHFRVHPGEILREEFLKPKGLSAFKLAREMCIPVPRVNDIVLERRKITPDTALRLSKLLGTTAEFWIHLQSSYDLSRTFLAIEQELESISPLEGDQSIFHS
jgi:addiction module HigA family antidote